MDDTIWCPLCQNKFRNLILKDKLYHPLSKTSSFIERSCFNNKNHYMQLVTDLTTNQVDFLKFSLDPSYNKFITINYFNNECILTLVNNTVIKIPKIIEPDFPLLLKLKQQVNLYSVFS